jgi:hypothetical protein
VRDFRRWHPGFNQAPPPAALTAQPPRFSRSPMTAVAYLP